MAHLHGGENVLYRWAISVCHPESRTGSRTNDHHLELRNTKTATAIMKVVPQSEVVYAGRVYRSWWKTKIQRIHSLLNA